MVYEIAQRLCKGVVMPRGCAQSQGESEHSRESSKASK